MSHSFNNFLLGKGRKISVSFLAVGATLALWSNASAVEVQTLLSTPITTTLEWYASPITGPTPGTATVDNLTGMGGNLEFSQPSGVGAAHLKTGPDNNDRAGATMQGNFGLASLALADIDLEYWYHKVFVSGGNAAAAPSLKLALFNPTGSGTNGAIDDSFGQLIYEVANQGAGNPPTDSWEQVVIDENTGSGTTASGGWWWTGGFGFANSGASAPFQSLAEWNAAFQGGTDATDYAGASVVDIQLGIGSFNQDTDVYFDDLLISINDGSISFSELYDFEPFVAPPAVPEPSTLLLAVCGGLIGLSYRRRK